MATVENPTNTVSAYDLPNYISYPAQDLSGFLQDYYSSMVAPGGLAQGYQGNYIAPFDPLQTEALSLVPGAVGASRDMYTQGGNYLNQAGQQLGAAGQYDPSKMQQHMNPYLSGVLGEISRLGDQNLTENVMPGVNSTFTEAGQFGSTRNGEFLNRAIRDNQQTISGAQSTAMNQAYGQAGTDYLNWDKEGQVAAGSLGNIGTALGAFGTAGSTQNWNDINSAMKLGTQARDIEQNGLDKQLAMWQSNWKTPLDAATGLSGILNNMKANTATTFGSNTVAQDPNAPWYNYGGSVLGSLFGQPAK